MAGSERIATSGAAAASSCCSQLLLLLLLLAAAPLQLLPGALASEGDASPRFWGCVQHCVNTGCVLPADGGPQACGQVRACNGGQPLPWDLSLFRWSCQDDCKHHCMWAIELSRPPSADPPPGATKYFGKWPFTRVLGMQEFASVAASLANMAANVHCFLRLKARVAGRAAPGAKGPGRHPGPGGRASAALQYPYMWLWAAYALAHVLAWLSSAAFHARDTRPTERLDYACADAVVAAGLLAAVLRAQGPRCGRLGAAAVLFVAAFFGRHLHYMLRVKFDYGLNMRVCLAAGLLQAAIWVGWAHATRHPARRTLYIFMAAAHAALLLEVLDFPPLLFGLLDAHACWHLTTVPLTFMWYGFLEQDALHCHLMAAKGGRAAA